MHDIVGARCLDLFAGSGALGIESLSRGASFVQFFESNRVVAKSLHDCIDLLQENESGSSDLNTRARVHVRDALEVLSETAPGEFDIAFLDPPFKAGLLNTSAALLEQNGWLTEHACIYVECDSKNHQCRFAVELAAFQSRSCRPKRISSLPP